jgi:hypothetical protein
MSADRRRGEVRVEQMWTGGPMRLFAPGRRQRKGVGGSFLAYQSGTLEGFASAYICANCGHECAGVYRIGRRWIGGCCHADT